MQRVKFKLVSYQYLLFKPHSTAYSQTDKKQIDEKFYDCDIDYQDLESSLRWMSDDMLTQLTPQMLGKR